MKKAPLILAAMALAVFGLTACGSSNGGSDTTAASTGGDTTATGTTAGGGGGSSVTIAADPNGSLAFTSDTAEAKAGSVDVKYDNSSSTPHDLVIEDSSGTNLAQTPVFTNDSKDLPLDLKPGTYTYYCSLPGHREAGMEGSLTVK